MRFRSHFGSSLGACAAGCMRSSVRGQEKKQFELDFGSCIELASVDGVRSIAEMASLQSLKLCLSGCELLTGVDWLQDGSTMRAALGLHLAEDAITFDPPMTPHYDYD